MRKMNWRVKLIGAFTLILIASLLFQLCYILPRVREREKTLAGRYLEQTARIIAYELAPDINQIRSILPNIADRPEFKAMDKSRIEQSMNQPHEDWNRVTALLVMDGAGQVLASGIGDLDWHGPEEIAEADCFALPLSEDRFHVNPPQYNASTGVMSVIAGTLIRSHEGKPVGVLIGAVRLDELIEQIAGYPLHAGYAAYVLHPNGTVIAHSETDIPALDGDPFPLDYGNDSHVGEAKQNSRVKNTAYVQYGKHGMEAPLPLGFSGWQLVVEAPMHTVLSASTELSKRLCVANIGFFGIALVIAACFSKRLADERNRAEKTLRIREERFREMFQNMSTGGQILEALPDGSDFIIKDINHAAERIARTPRDRVIGKRYTEAFPRHSRLKFFKRIQKTWQTNKPEQNSAIIEVDGVIARWEECYIYKLPSGEVVILIDDVTEQKKAADALEAAEAKYRELVQNANAIILRLSATGEITFINEFAQDFFGYTEEEILGQNILGTLLPETDSMGRDLRVMLKDAMAHPERFATNENENMSRNGERLWVSWTNKAIRGKDGKVVEFFCVGTDVTERKHAEEHLRTRLRYEKGLAACSHTLMTQTPDALPRTLQHLLAAADASRVCIFENRDDPRDGLCMRQVHEVCAPGIKPSTDNPNPPCVPYKYAGPRWAEVLSKNEPVVGAAKTFPQSERDIMEANGVLSVLVLPIWVAGAWYGFIGFDHTTECRIWNEEDILLLRAASDMIGIYLEDQRTEAALRESELRYRAFFEQSAAAIMLVDAKTGAVLESNARAHELLGRSSESQSKLKIAHYEASDDDEVPRRIAAVMASGQKLSESRIRTRDGRMRDVLLDCKALHVDGRDMIQTIWLDITERRNAERELKKSHEELRELTARLQHIREEESSRISREIHDELGQGLTGLNLNLAWLQKQLPAVCKTERLTQITEKVALMSSLVDEAIRTIQKIAADLRPSRLDLGLIEAIEWEIEQFRERTGLQCDLSVMGPDVILGDASSMAIFRILQESLTNVARHAGASHVWVSLTFGDGRLLLQVTDNGRGFDDAELTKLQSLGIRGMRERALSVSGEVVIEGVPGEGTTVNVSVPLARHGDSDARFTEMPEH